MKLNRLILGVLSACAIAFGAHAQSTSVSINNLPTRTLTNIVGHDINGLAGREPVIDFIKPAAGSHAVGNLACWGTTANLITDCGTPGSMALQNSSSVAITGGSANFTGTFSIGGVTQTFPASGLLAGTSDIQTFTGKTFDTAGSGNVFKISGTSITGVTGTGFVVLGSGPAITLANATGLPLTTGITGTLGVGNGGTGGTTQATARSGIGAAASGANTDITSLSGVSAINKVAITAPATSATLTIANGTTLTAASSTSVGQGQYLGTATNDNATAGNIGEYISATVASGSAVTLTPSNTAVNIASVSLTAGDWMCSGNAAYTFGSTSSVTSLQGWINTTSATGPVSPGNGAYFVQNASYVSNTTNIYPIGQMRLSLSATTTVYLSGAAVWTTAAPTAYGFIGCRRAR